MGRMFRYLILFVLIILLLTPTFKYVNSLANKEVSLDYSQDIKDVSSAEVEESIEETVDDYMIPQKIILDVPLISQLPDLINGCEVTSLTMLLNYTGVSIDKNELVREVKIDTTPMVKDSDGNIIKWGNPNDGFVGDIEGYDKAGYSIYPKALLPLSNKYLNNTAKDLTGETVDTLIKYLSQKSPILVWVTTDFSVPDNFITWTKNGKQIRATFSEHCVVLTGYDENSFYYNDPLNVGKNKVIDKETFEEVWSSMGKLALSYANE